jgi:TP901 family phage tail tape measure protein
VAAEIKITINWQTGGGGPAAAKRDIQDLGDTAQRAGGGFSALREVATGALRQVGVIATQAFLEAGRAAVGFFKDSISLAGDFEAGMAGFGAAAGAGFEPGTEALAEFHDLFIDMGKKLPVSTSEVQQAAIALVKGGLDPAVIAGGALESSLNFAAAAGMSLEAAAELTVKQLGSFVPIGASVTEQTEFMANAQNLLVKAAGASTLNVDKLGDAMLAAGGQAQASGLKYEDFVTTMGLISPSFGSAAEAGTSFKNFIVRLQPSTEKAKDTMIALGLATEDGASKFYDATGTFIGMREASELLQNATANLTDAERVQALQTIFGNDAMGAANALLNSGAEGYDAFAAKMEAANGVAEQSAAVQQGFNFVMENIKGTIEALQIQIGEYLLPYLTELVTTGNLLVNAITGDQAAFDALSPSLQGVIVAIQDGITQAGLFMAAFQAWLPTIQPILDLIGANLMPILATLAGVLGVVVVGAVASVVASFLSIAVPVAAVVAIVYGLYQAWQTNFAGIRTTVETVMTAVAAFIQVVLAQVMLFWQTHGAEIMLFLQTTWDTIYQIFSVALELIRIVVSTVFTAIAGFITAHGTEIQAYLRNAWLIISGIITAALTLIKGIITAALQLIKGDFTGAWTTIKTMSATFVLQMWQVIKAGLDNIAILWNFVWELLKRTFQDTLNSIVGWVIQTMTGIANAIRGMADQVIGAAQSVGGGIVSGIINGIKDGVGAIMDAARSAAQSALDAAMSALGMSSPSKEFAKIGLMSAEGMAIGLDRGAPMVAAAGQQTASAALAGASYDQRRSSSTTINYYGATNAPSADYALASALATV